MLERERLAGLMSRQQLLRLLAMAEQQPALRRRLHFEGSWQAWLERVQALGFAVTAADLRALYNEDCSERLFHSRELPRIRPLR